MSNSGRPSVEVMMMMERNWRNIYILMIILYDLELLLINLITHVEIVIP